MNLAERLKIARESTGKSQKEIADLVHVSYRAWQGYEAGENVPGGKVFESLVRLGFNGTWLLTGEDVIRRGIPVTITKETPEGFGRAKELTFKIHPDFSVRLQKELGSRSTAWLAEASKLPVDRITGFISDKAIPTVDELIALAETLGVSEIWLAEGDVKKEATNEGYTVINPLSGEEVYVPYGFNDELQVAVTQAIIELAAPDLDEQTVKNYASLYPETIKSLKEGSEVVPAISDIKKIARVFASVYDFYDSDNKDVELSRVVTSRAIKLVERLASKGKAKAETKHEEAIRALQMDFT